MIRSHSPSGEVLKYEQLDVNPARQQSELPVKGVAKLQITPNSAAIGVETAVFSINTSLASIFGCWVVDKTFPVKQHPAVNSLSHS
jgi:hypothetical protein